MRVLLLGASGFIGGAIARSLKQAGYAVTGLARDPEHARQTLPDIAWIGGDLRHMQRAQDWAGPLAGIDTVINAAGALQTGLRDNVDAVQRAAMLALYEAAMAAEVGQVIQLSAAGAEDQRQSDFMGTKAAADATLAATGLRYTVLRPGLVIGRNCFGGTELIRTAAALPWVQATPAGIGTLQCAALSDVVAAVHAALEQPEKATGFFDLVEQEPRSLDEMIGLHRQWLGLPPARMRVHMSMGLVRVISKGADLLGWLGWRSPLRSNSIAALVHGVAGDTSQGRALLGREPLSLPQTLAALGPAGKADRWHARLAGLYPLALLALLLLWLGSGVLGFTRTHEAVRLLTDGGMPLGMARACVFAGSAADLAIAAGLLWRPVLGKALAASLLLAGGYLAGSLVWRADLWLDPLGPMLKVLPILALTAMCMAMAEER